MILWWNIWIRYDNNIMYTSARRSVRLRVRTPHIRVTRGIGRDASSAIISQVILLSQLLSYNNIYDICRSFVSPNTPQARYSACINLTTWEKKKRLISTSRATFCHCLKKSRATSLLKKKTRINTEASLNPLNLISKTPKRNQQIEKTKHKKGYGRKKRKEKKKNNNCP